MVGERLIINSTTFLLWKLQDDDTASIKSYGSHKNRVFKDESHKGSAETMDGEEKRDASKEERMDHEGGMMNGYISRFI